MPKKNLASEAKKLSLKDDPEYIPAEMFDEDNINSLYHMLPEKSMKHHLDNCRDTIQQYSTDEIRKKVIENVKQRDISLVEFLRLNLWREYKNAQLEKRKMSPNIICEGVCGPLRLNTLLSKPSVAAYIFSRPLSEEIKLQAIVDRGFSRLIEVLDLPITDHNNKPDYKLIKEIREIYKLMEMRLKGGITQKVHQTSLNVNTDSKGLGNNRDLTPEEIDKQLLELQNKMNPNEVVIDVEPIRRDTTETKTT